MVGQCSAIINSDSSVINLQNPKSKYLIELRELNRIKRMRSQSCNSSQYLLYTQFISVFANSYNEMMFLIPK